MTRLHVTLAMMLLWALTVRAAEDVPTGAPDQAATRAKVDGLIKQFLDQKSKATLGMLQHAMELSISFGAPAWNDGDHDACGTFYMKSAEAICKAFPDQASATPAAWAAIGDLQAALARAKGTQDMDAKAWAMRYAFDKTAISLATEAQRATALLDLGRQCIQRAELAEAEDAFNAVMVVSKELDGLQDDDMPQACAVAPTALVDALAGEKKYAQAAAMVVIAIARLPKLPEVRRDMGAVYGDPAVYQKMMDGLRAEARKSPNDAAVQFLLGYEDYFAGLKASARGQFEKVLKLDQENTGAKAFMKQIKPEDKDAAEDPTQREL